MSKYRFCSDEDRLVLQQKATSALFSSGTPILGPILPVSIISQKFLFVLLVGYFAIQSINVARAQKQWVDQSGKYAVTGDLLAFNDELIILRTSDGELISMAIEDLSEASRAFMRSEEAVSVLAEVGLQKWTLRNGLQLVGQVVSHEARDVTLQRRRGSLYVNDRTVQNLPPEYRKLLPLIVGHIENLDFDDLASMEKWFNARHGFRPVTYHCEGVKLAMRNGDEFLFPYFIFSDSDRRFLEAGAKEAQVVEAGSEERQKQDLYTQVRAAEYQRALEMQQADLRVREAQFDRHIKRVQLGLLAVAADVTDLWEVALIPFGDGIFQAQLVVVPARNSREASQLALARWPNHTVGPVRRVTR